LRKLVAIIAAVVALILAAAAVGAVAAFLGQLICAQLVRVWHLHSGLGRIFFKSNQSRKHKNCCLPADCRLSPFACQSLFQMPSYENG